MIPGSSLFDRYHAALMDFVRREIEQVRAFHEGGAAQDFSEYKRQVGYLQALRKIEAEATELYKKVTET